MKNKGILLVVFVAMIASLGGVSFYYWYMNNNYIYTEDARVDGTIFKVSPQVTGKIVEIRVDEGDVVRPDDVIVRIDYTTLPAGVNYDLSVVRSPIAGTVIKCPVNEGEIAAPGQPVAMIVDPEKMYVTANIEETKIERVRPGQKVEFSVDNRPGKKFLGRVASIGKATVSTFSLLPSTNTGGNYTKVVQRVPVKIVFESKDRNGILFGANAMVRVHLRDGT